MQLQRVAYVLSRLHLSGPLFLLCTPVPWPQQCSQPYEQDHTGLLRTWVELMTLNSSFSPGMMTVPCGSR